MFDQYDKSDFDGVKRLDIRDYSNVQHTLRALYSHTFFGKNTLIVGGDYMRDYLMSYQFTNEAGSYAQYTADAFAQFEINPTDFLNITTSLRYDYFSEAKAQNFSPKLGLMYKLGNCSLRGSYAVGFRAPTLNPTSTFPPQNFPVIQHLQFLHIYCGYYKFSNSTELG